MAINTRQSEIGLRSLPNATNFKFLQPKSENWERKFFSNDQQTFILLFNAQVPKANYKKKSELPRLMVEWKTKSKRDAKGNQTLAGFLHLSFYTQQI
ncbi:hypothetical protein C2G38_2176923 [Gigaspora rosea]|uniref:Uncharacterized protein n=1 Tax=Gigaspora rosea TaxID=44941 RepID=A0A397VH70_9GLOM|nr:hypothetical protein C2G38_2176923 [Gigaspora rosea]